MMVSDYSLAKEKRQAGGISRSADVLSGSGAETTAASQADHVQSARDTAAVDAGAALVHAQSQFESEKGTLARVLHDDLGGLLVGAAMDVGWLVRQPLLPNTVLDRLSRVSMMLRSAIDLQRTLIEELQPSLLKAVGLFAALRWQIKRMCEAAGVAYAESYPATEVGLDTSSKVTLFRLVQESLEYFLVDGCVSKMSIDVAAEGSELRCHLTSEHAREPDERPPAVESLFNTAMHYRASSIRGDFTVSTTPSGRVVRIRMPL